MYGEVGAIVFLDQTREYLFRNQSFAFSWGLQIPASDRSLHGARNASTRHTMPDESGVTGGRASAFSCRSTEMESR
jgi:hypothetical protein